MASNTTGSNNIGIGFGAGNNLSNGCNNIVIGTSAAAPNATSCNTIVIGTTAYTAQYAPSATWISLSDRRDKTEISPIPVGLDFIREVRPVKFTWNTRDGNRVNLPDAGFIAQDLLDLIKKYNVADFLKLAIDENPDSLTADPGKLLPVVVKAIQELAIITDQLQNRITQLEAAINKP
jgi:hypothetical protein